MYIMAKLKVLSTTKARNILPEIIEKVKQTRSVFILGRRNVPEIVIIKFPEEYSVNASDITNINTYSHSFDFLRDEPDLYSRNEKR